MVNEVLKELGLSPEEADIYSLLLDKGPLSATSISKNSKVKRTYVYAVCKSLVKKGLVSIVTEKNVTTFSPLSPDHLMDLAERQKQNALKASQTLEGILPTLKNKYQVIDSKPVVTYYEGLEGIKKVYQDTLETNGEILALVETSEVNKDVYDWVTSIYVNERVKKNIKVRAIVSSGDKTNKYTDLDKKELRETKIVDNKLYPLKNEINIYGDKVAIINNKKEDNLLGIIIENKIIAQTFKSWFNISWKYN